MLRKSMKMLLVSTSLAPALLVMAVDQFFEKGASQFFWQLVIIVACLVTIAAGVMVYMSRNAERMVLSVLKAKNSDKETLTFLLAYLLPVLIEHKYLFTGFNPPTITMMILVSLAIYHSNAFDFNPLLGVFGYHFYEVEGEDAFPYLLISRNTLRKPTVDLKVVQLCDYTFLHVEA
jgi:hypothetical protein